MRTEHEIVQELAAMDSPGHDDGFGGRPCIFCGSDLTCEEHKPDCLWVEAKKLIYPESKI